MASAANVSNTCVTVTMACTQHIINYLFVHTVTSASVKDDIDIVYARLKKLDSFMIYEKKYI